VLTQGQLLNRVAGPSGLLGQSEFISWDRWWKVDSSTKPGFCQVKKGEWLPGRPQGLRAPFFFNRICSVEIGFQSSLSGEWDGVVLRNSLCKDMEHQNIFLKAERWSISRAPPKIRVKTTALECSSPLMSGGSDHLPMWNGKCTSGKFPPACTNAR
jgi:hypothetical protein